VLFNLMKLLLYYFIARENIVFGGKLISVFVKAVFINDGKDIQSLCFRAVFRTIKKGLTITSFQKRRLRRNRLRKISRNRIKSWS